MTDEEVFKIVPRTQWYSPGLAVPSAHVPDFVRVVAAAVRAEAVADERRRIAELESELAKYKRLIADMKTIGESAIMRTGEPPLLAAGSVPVATPEPDFAASLGKHAAYISRTVTASYPDGMDAELVMRRRVGKIFVEAGELGDAIEGWTGENPRKGVYATREDVIKELIDCASAALCAVEYMTGDRGLSVALVAQQVAGNAQRLSEAIPDHCEPVATPEPKHEATRDTYGVEVCNACTKAEGRSVDRIPVAMYWDSCPFNPVATPPAEPAAPRLWPCEHGERGWHRTDDNRHCLGGAAPSQPVTCEHGETEMHPVTPSAWLGVWCPGPVSVPKESSE